MKPDTTLKAATPSFFRRALALVLTSLAFTFTLSAQEPKRTFDVPAGEAEQTLKQFATQAQREIVFSPDNVAGLKTNPVQGEYAPQEALDQMLADTGLIATQDTKTGAFAVRRDSRPNGQRAAQTSGRPASRSVVEDGVVKLGTYEVLGSKLINADLPRSRDDVQPYVVFDRTTIDASLATNLDEFFRTRLPMNQQFSPGFTTSSVNLRGLGTNQTLILLDGRRMPPVPGGGGTNGQSDLNGIPLSMIERIEVLPSTASGIYGGGATGGVINIITRKDYSGVEINGTYSNPFDTDAMRLRLEVNGSMQLEDGKTSISFNSSRLEGSRLLVQDRDLVDRGRALLLANNRNAFYGAAAPPLGYLPNIRSQSGANLVLKNGTPLNSPITFVPAGYAGPAADSGTALVANAGNYNLELPDTVTGRRGTLAAVPEQTSYGFSARRRFSDRVELLVDASRFDNRNQTDVINLGASSVTLSAAAPNNPFTTPIVVAFPATNTPTTARNSFRSLSDRLLAGIVVRLPHDWSAGIDYVWSQARNRSQSVGALLGDPDGTGPGASYTAALASGTLNVVRDLNAFPLDYSPYLMPNPYTLTDTKLRANEFTLRGSGPIYRLPAGDVMLSTTAQYRDENIPGAVRMTASASNPNPTYNWDAPVELSSRAYFTELRVPLFAEEAPAGWQRGLEFQFAVRRDESEATARAISLAPVIPGPDGPIPSVPLVVRDFAATKTTMGLKYAPIQDLTFRASAGTGYLAPALWQLSGSTPSTGNFLITDPKRNNMQTLMQISAQTGGNPDLQAEESESVSAGLVLTPRFLSGFRLSLDYTSIVKTNEIGILDSELLFRYEDRLPGYIVRAPLTPQDQALGYTGGLVQSVDFRSTNVAGKRVEAYDLQIDYTWKTESLGEFNAFAAATYQSKFSTKTFEDVPYINIVGTSASLKWRGNGGLTWTKGRLSIGWAMQYYDSYLIYSPTSAATTIASQILNQGSPTIPSQVYHDVQVRYQWGVQPDGWQRYLANTTVSLGVQNVFNTLPPATATTSANTGGYSAIADPRLARYTLTLRKRF